MLSFYLKAVKCLKKEKKNPIKKQLLNTKKFCLIKKCGIIFFSIPETFL